MDTNVQGSCEHLPPHGRWINSFVRTWYRDFAMKPAHHLDWDLFAFNLTHSPTTPAGPRFDLDARVRSMRLGSFHVPAVDAGAASSEVSLARLRVKVVGLISPAASARDLTPLEIPADRFHAASCGLDDRFQERRNRDAPERSGA
jgi:hypothetical protein